MKPLSGKAHRMESARQCGALAFLAVNALAVSLLTGCAMELVVIESSPTGADVSLNGEYKGKTPLSLRLDSNHIYEITAVQNTPCTNSSRKLINGLVL